MTDARSQQAVEGRLTADVRPALMVRVTRAGTEKRMMMMVWQRWQCSAECIDGDGDGDIDARLQLSRSTGREEVFIFALWKLGRLIDPYADSTVGSEYATTGGAQATW
jgi:hypothetical protein